MVVMITFAVVFSQVADTMEQIGQRSYSPIFQKFSIEIENMLTEHGWRPADD